ncbi:MAG: helix-turn-helix domain-containing protein [Nitrospirota bacterium]
MKTIRKTVEHKPPPILSGDKQSLIIDHTNKFTVVENWLFDRGDLGAGDKLIYIVLKSWANCESIWPSHKTIAKKASVSVATVKRTLTCLMTKRLLVVESGKGNGGCNIYHLCGPGGEKGIPRGVAHRERPPVAHPELPGSSQRATTNTSIKRQNTTTTVVVVDDIKILVKGTPFQRIDEQSLRMFTTKYCCNNVFDALDMLIATYRQSERPVNNPAAILASGLSKGVIPPFGYVPYHERAENDRKAKEATELRRRADAEKRKAEEEALSKKIEQFDALPHPEQEEWVQRALAELSPVLRGSKKAVRSMAIELSNKELRSH